MKTRSSFVSNSSSSSFVANLDRLTPEQLDIIMNYPTDTDPTHHCKWGPDDWAFKINTTAGLVEGWTIMDNGDLEFYLEATGITNCYRILGD